MKSKAFLFGFFLIEASSLFLHHVDLEIPRLFNHRMLNITLFT
jgi:hypothetical protein